MSSLMTTISIIMKKIPSSPSKTIVTIVLLGKAYNF